MQVGDDYDICKIANLQWRPTSFNMRKKILSCVITS